jgi:hypothetical protein
LALLKAANGRLFHFCSLKFFRIRGTISRSQQQRFPTMKRILSVVGGVFLLIALVVAGFIGYAAYQGNALDASSKAYVETNLPPIVSTWSKDELIKRASPQLLKIISEDPDQFTLLFQKLSSLGALKNLSDFKGEAKISYAANDGKAVTASYVAKGQFTNGDATISMRLIQNAGQWQFLLLNVNSPLFLKH